MEHEEAKYLPRKGRITHLQELSPTEKLFRIELEQPFRHIPGQFVMVSLFGIGEAPISIASSPTQGDPFELVVRKVGALTTALHALSVGDPVGIRGPFGNGFPVEHLSGKDLLMVAGGTGIIPLRSMIRYAIDQRRNFGRVVVLLGCKTPQDLLFAEEYRQWEERFDIHFSCTVNRADPEWKGNVGLITELIPRAEVDPGKTFSLLVGPAPMVKAVVERLLEHGIPSNHVFLSMDRRMRCGLGKCGHCQLDGLYTCQNGPIFRYSEVSGVAEAFL